MDIDSIEIEYTVYINKKVNSTRGQKCTKTYPLRTLWYFFFFQEETMNL